MASSYFPNSNYRLDMGCSVGGQDVAGNWSDVDWYIRSVKLDGTGYQSPDQGRGSAYVNGQVWADDSFGFNFTQSTPQTIVHASGTRRVTHNDDGTRTITFGGTVTLGPVGTATIPSQNFVLPRIARGPRVRAAGTWRNTVAYVRVAGTWRIAIPYVRSGGTWRVGGG